MSLKTQFKLEFLPLYNGGKKCLEKFILSQFLFISNMASEHGMFLKKQNFLDMYWYTSQILHDMLNGASSRCFDGIACPVAW